MNRNASQTAEPVPPGPWTDTMYRVAVRSAWVAAVFSAAVCLLLLVDFARRQGQDPLETERFLILKGALASRAAGGSSDRGAPLEAVADTNGNQLLAMDLDQLRKRAGELSEADLRAWIRQLDLRLREVYFQQRQYTQRGVWLLLGGTVVLAAAVKWASILHRRLPRPQPVGVPDDVESRVAQRGRWAVWALALVAAAGTIVLALSGPSPVPDRLAELATAGPAGATASGAGEATEKARPAEPEAGESPVAPPTEAEIRRNWPRFRGPGGRGISHHEGIPTAWDGASGEGILWKAAVPLPGNNSPVVWGDRVFLTGATETEREVYAFDASGGKLLWKKSVPLTPEGSGEPPEVMEDTGFAASTTATDGHRIFAIFPNGDVAALDFQGNPLWTRGLGIPKNSYGHASSLVVYRDRLLIQFDQGGRNDDLSRLLALDTATGQTRWEAPRQVPNSWTTPIVARVGDRDQIITAADPWVIAYDAADGTELWRAKCLSQDVGPSPTFAGGIVYVANEFPALSAIRADGQGDVTQTHVLWEGEDGLPDTSSPLATEQFVFVLASYGILTCYDAQSGEMLWDKEFEDATFTSSPSMVGDLLYIFGEIEEEDPSGDWVAKCHAWVLRPDREGCEGVGQGRWAEGCVTSPAFQEGRLYIRGEKHLFCIGRR